MMLVPERKAWRVHWELESERMEDAGKGDGADVGNDKRDALSKSRMGSRRMVVQVMQIQVPPW